MQAISTSLYDALKDTLITIPFLLAAFFLIDVIQHRFGHGARERLYNLGKWGPIYGALLGSLPQCGFSIIASSFFIEKLITPGTLLAVYIATSDEAIPILLATPKVFSVVAPLIALKIIVGMLAGLLVDLFWKRYTVRSLNNTKKQGDFGQPCIGDQKRPYREILGHATHHTIQVAGYIFIATFLLSFAFAHGESHVIKFFRSLTTLQPIITSFFGLIPNCATSVLITQAYILKLISFGALFAGLSSNAGLGLLVLFRNKKTRSEAFKVVLLLLFFSIGAGILIDLMI